MAHMICYGISLVLLPITSNAQTLPFAFGNRTNDISLARGDGATSDFIPLPQPMVYFDRNITSVFLLTDGYLYLVTNGNFVAGQVSAYYTDIDTRNGGVDQNEIWLRVGNRTNDLNIAREIISGNGTFFAPQTIIVTTWNKVEANPQRIGAQNTFQMALAYSATGETWLILAYRQLQFFQAGRIQQALVEYKNRTSGVVQNFFTVSSNATMTAILNGTNCNRTGIYVHRINKGEPTKAPTKAPTKSPIFSIAQPLPFAFGNISNDIFLPLADEGFSDYIPLAQPMAYLDSNVTSVRQVTNGVISLYNVSNSGGFAGRVNAYFTNIDTRNGGVDQNEIWMRTGNRTDDLNIARDIIAGNGTFFSPQAIIIGTWNKVEAYPQQAGAQNTFQMAIAYSATGETWLILAFKQLQFFQAGNFQQASVEYRNSQRTFVQNFFTITSDANMTAMLNGTNCYRAGVYVHRINKGGPTKAPTNAPTKSPTKALTKAPTKAPTTSPTSAECGLFGWSIFCPLTFCGVLGRWVGFCKN